jgi:hypothetical protein
MIAYDYSAAAIAPAALRAAGVGTVMRYVSTAGNEKNITAAEYRELTAAGITVGLVYETSADWMLGGRAAGVAAARAAREQATAVGYPAWHRIWYAADFAAAAAQLPTVVACLEGAAAAEGTPQYVAAYGDFDVCSRAIAAGFPAPWQTDAWSSGRWCAGAVLQQTGQQTTCGGVQVDLNNITGRLFLLPPPALKPQLEEETMLIIDAPRSAEAGAVRDMWLLGNGKYTHIPDDASYEGIKNAGVEVAVIGYPLHEAWLAAYGVAGVTS